MTNSNKIKIDDHFYKSMFPNKCSHPQENHEVFGIFHNYFYS